MKINKKIKKTVLILTAALFTGFLVIILLISPIAKHFAVKYAEKVTGRQIKMGLVYVNPFTGYVHISNLKIYESRNSPDYYKGDSIFISADAVAANFALLKLISKKIEISGVILDRPRGIIIQTGRELNFSDVIKRFTPKEPRNRSSGFRFSILDFKIKNGEFWYHEKETPFLYYLRDVNIESKGKTWNVDTLAVTYSFVSGPESGSAKGTFGINFRSLDYHLHALIRKFDLKFLEQYLKSLVNYGKFRSSLDADIIAKGNFRNKEDLIAKGLLQFNDFHIGKNTDEDYASFDKLVLQIIELSPKNHQYRFDSLSLTHPYFKYERYDYLDNLQMMFGKNGKNVADVSGSPGRFNLILTIGMYIKGLAQNFFQSDYKINRLAIYKGNFRYNDFAISEKFSVALSPLYFLADSINKNQKSVNAILKSGVQPFGNISVSIAVNPSVKGDFDMKYHIGQVAASVFNPYLITYTSYPLDRGTLEINGTWNLRDSRLQSVNHLVIIDPRTTKRLRNKDAKWLPLPLILSFIRERGNVIDYEIPISGNLKDPKFHLHDVIMDLLENIFVKPATTAYRVQVKKMETEIEKSLTLKWALRQSSLLPAQEKFVNAMVEFLGKNPDATIAVYPMLYTEKEKEHILFYEARKKYYLIMNGKNNSSFSEDDSIKADHISVKDSLFVRQLNKQADAKMLFTIQEKCMKYIGAEVVDAKVSRLNKDRQNAFLAFFRSKMVDTRVKFHPCESTIPYNGFSFYRIVYKGKFPEAITKAYRKMNELNDEAPRKKYKNDRKKAKADLKQ